MNNIDELNKIFSFKDAVKVVENVLTKTRNYRDSSHEGDYDGWRREQARVEVLEDVLEALSNESGIMHNVREHDDRQG